MPYTNEYLRRARMTEGSGQWAVGLKVLQLRWWLNQIARWWVLRAGIRPGHHNGAAMRRPWAFRCRTRPTTAVRIVR